jgi:hypothetical protein
MRQRRSGCCAVEPSLSSTRSQRGPPPGKAEGLTLERAPPHPRNTDKARNLGWYLNGLDHSAWVVPPAGWLVLSAQRIR